jgi:hypothetical protein
LLRPYNYKFDGVNSYVFYTSSKQKYFFQFLDITELYYELNPALTSNVYEFFFFPEKKNKTKSDPRIAKTITMAITRMLKNNPNVIICFTCDSDDRKEDSRKRLFHKWFREFNTKNIVKLDKSVTSDEISLHRSIIFMKDNSDGRQNIEHAFFKLGLDLE